MRPLLGLKIENSETLGSLGMGNGKGHSGHGEMNQVADAAVDAGAGAARSEAR